MKAKRITAVCMAVGIMLVGATGVIAFASGNPYENHKSAVVSTIGKNNLTANAAVQMKQNGKVIASGYGTYEKSSDAQFLSITSDVAGKNFVQEEYSDSSVKIKSDGINYTEKSRKEKHHGNEQLTPNMIKLAEMTADLFVGDLSNQFTMSGNTVSVTLTDVHIDEVLENLELAQYKNESVGKFSMGMKQCLGFASAILHKPELLILDEPTNGLDIKGTVRVRSMLKSYQAEGGTVLISSHIASEIQDYYLHIVNEKEKAK